MTDWTSVLWKILKQLAKKWPEMVQQRPFLNSLSFSNSLYYYAAGVPECLKSGGDSFAIICRNDELSSS